MSTSTDLGAGPVEPLVHVAAEVDEVDLVARDGGLELLAQPREVGRAVDERARPRSRC